MSVNRFNSLPTPIWPRLRSLLDDHTPAKSSVTNLSIGSPKHPFPSWLMAEMQQAAAQFNDYPDNDGTAALRGAITAYIARRYGVAVDPDTQVMALNGTREGLFNAGLLFCEADSNVLIPNPFYQTYMTAAMATGSQPVYVPAVRAGGYLPDLDAIAPEVLNKTSVFFLCSPSNPQGAVADSAYWAHLFGLAEKYDFKVFADECYSEIYRTDPPAGALEVTHKNGFDPERVIAFHSLSKRSNVPGLRSGFVASGAQNIEQIKRLRAYAGAPLAGPMQHVSAKLWADERHVVQNRHLYCDKFNAADTIFSGIKGYQSPTAGFFLWLPVENDTQAALKLWKEKGVRVLPGSYLAQTVKEQNPGDGYIRVALVAPKKQTQHGLEMIRDCLYA